MDGELARESVREKEESVKRRMRKGFRGKKDMSGMGELQERGEKEVGDKNRRGQNPGFDGVSDLSRSIACIKTLRRVDLP